KTAKKGPTRSCHQPPGRPRFHFLLKTSDSFASFGFVRPGSPDPTPRIAANANESVTLVPIRPASEPDRGFLRLPRPAALAELLKSPRPPARYSPDEASVSAPRSRLARRGGFRREAPTGAGQRHG